LLSGLLLSSSFGFFATAQIRQSNNGRDGVAGAEEQAAKGTEKTETEEVDEATWCALIRSSYRAGSSN